TLSLAENLPRHGTRLAPFIPKDEAGGERDTGNLACEKRQAGNHACESNSIGIHKTKRNLPHWQRDAAIYYVTFRLADSLPQSELKVWRDERDAWLDTHPEPWTDDAWAEYHRRFSTRLEAWLDHGYGACVLAEPALRHEVEACLRHFDGERYHLHAFVIMPNHVHVLLEPLSGNRLDTILHGIKGISARRCHECLGKGGTFWMDESFDHLVRSEAQLAHYLDYIRENPAKARLLAEKVTVYEKAGASAGSAVPQSFDTQAGLPALRSEQAGLPVSPSLPASPASPRSLRVAVAAAEDAVYNDANDPLVNWDEETLAAELTAAGFVAVRLERAAFTRQQRISSAELDRWFATDTPGSYARRLRAAGLAEEELRQFRTAITAALAGQTVSWPTTTVFITARAPLP
ncbi:MAG: transposase, partial [bacterium]